MDKKKKKASIIFLVVIVLLFAGSMGYGTFFRVESDMDRAIPKVKSLIAQAKQEIKRELAKPWWKRLISSLFGLEKNKFRKIIGQLPGIIKSAMPKVALKHSFSFPQDEEGLDCEEMKLPDALQTLQRQKIQIGKLFWRLDSSIQDGRIKPGGYILKAQKNTQGKAELVLQFPHQLDHLVTTEALNLLKKTADDLIRAEKAGFSQSPPLPQIQPLKPSAWIVLERFPQLFNSQKWQHYVVRHDPGDTS